MKNLFAAILLLTCYLYMPLFARNAYSDTTKVQNIQEITVSHQRVNFYCEDKNITRFDSLTLVLNQNTTIAELLQLNTPITIKTYGPAGSTSTISMRGTGASQTQVSWNGFPVNSITTGDCDLSLLPTNSVEQVQIIHGAPASMYGSGTFGGAVELNNKPNFSNTQYIKVGTELTSFADSFSQLSNKNYNLVDGRRYTFQIKEGNPNTQYQIQGFEQKAANKFIFTDKYRFNSPLVYQTNASMQTWGIIQTFNHKINNNSQLNAGLWLQSRDKEIPQIMGKHTQSNQSQTDASDKAFIRYIHTNTNTLFMIKSGYAYDYLLYTDKANATDSNYSIYSKITAHRFMNDANLRVYVNKKITYDVGVALYNMRANVSSYNGIKTENWYTLYSAVKYNYMPIIINLSGRFDYVLNTKTQPQASAGIAYNTFDNRLVLKYNISSKYRLPTFNDKYWINSGNPLLKPENGWGTEAGFDLTWLKSLKSLSVINFTLYALNINNWIQWQPAENGFWKPVNYKAVYSRGIELGAEYNYCFNKFSVKTTYKYYYTKSTITNVFNNANSSLVNKQLPYTPLQSSLFTFLVLYKNIDLQYIQNFKGSFYSIESNTDNKMPPVNIVNIATGLNLNVKGVKYRFEFKVQNLFNVQYQLIKSYAMPGTTYLLGGYVVFGT